MDSAAVIPPQRLKEQAEKLCDTWLEPWEPVDGQVASRKLRFLYFIDYQQSKTDEPVLESIDMELLESKFGHFYDRLVGHWNNCVAARLTEDEALTQRFRQLAEVVWYSYTETYSAVRCALAERNANMPEVPPSMLSLRFAGFIAFDPNNNNKLKLTPMQQLILFLVDKLYRLGWRRFNGDCYEQIRRNGVGTHAWRAVKSIDKFVYSATPKEQHYEQWTWMTSASNMAKTCIEFLKHSVDAQFPDLRKTRGVISFANGVYVCRDKAFYPYERPEPDYAGELADDLPQDLVACNFIDRPFVDYERNGVVWRDIETPALQGIFDHQGLEDEVCWWIYGLLGRLLYAVNEVDRWQVILFFKGTAGTGKSTLCTMVSWFYELCDVGILSNRVEPQFGLAQFVDKMLFIAPEIKRDIQLDQADVQTMVAGERMSIARKHQDPALIEWTAPGVLAGNEVPNWVDNSGSISRRMVVVQFPKKVERTDTLLGDKLKAELPHIIAKCNACYLHMFECYGNCSLWDDALPSYFKKTSRTMQASCNALIAFLGSDYVCLGAELYCLEREFQQQLNIFIKQANFNAPYRWEPDFYNAIFADNGLHIQETELPWPPGDGDQQKGRYIRGCGAQSVGGKKR